MHETEGKTFVSSRASFSELSRAGSFSALAPSSMAFLPLALAPPSAFLYALLLPRPHDAMVFRFGFSGEEIRRKRRMTTEDSPGSFSFCSLPLFHCRSCEHETPNLRSRFVRLRTTFLLLLLQTPSHSIFRGRLFQRTQRLRMCKQRRGRSESKPKKTPRTGTE